jgi:hypothetical protein
MTDAAFLSPFSATFLTGWEVYDPKKEYGSYTIHDRKK